MTLSTAPQPVKGAGVFEEENIAESIVVTLGHEARLVRQAALAATSMREGAGLLAVADALRKYGAWRAGKLANSGDMRNDFRGWGSAELLGLNQNGWGQLLVGPTGMELTVHSSPEMLHFRQSDVEDFVAVHYGNLLAGIAEARGWQVDAPARQGLSHTFRVGTVDEVDAVRPDFSTTLRNTPLEILTRTTENRGALIVFLGRELEQRFGADGEEMFRIGLRGFGSERGSAMRLDHLSRGLELNLENMMALYDSGGDESVWKYRDAGVLTPKVWSQDCTHCPFVQNWTELDGLRYAEIYDHEFHLSQFKAYRHDIEVRWGELQSRGDATCEFRFSIAS